MIIVKVEDAYTSKVDCATLIKSAQTSLNYLGISDESDLSIVITGDEQLQQLNIQFRGVDTPTDVLAFPSDFTDPS